MPRRRECPRDRTPLRKEGRKSLVRRVEVDVCPRCGGIFLDKGEIRSLTGRSDLHDLLTTYLGLDADSHLVCPSCEGLIDGEDAGGVRVDVCLTCKGVWLDAGELERLAAEEASFLDFPPEKMEEVLNAKWIDQTERRRALRGLFGGLRRR